MDQAERVRRARIILGVPCARKGAGLNSPHGTRTEGTDRVCATPGQVRRKGRKVSSLKCREDDISRGSKCTYKWKYRSCASKKRYRNESTARRVARNCERHRPGQRLHCYYCPICNGWHLTRATWNDRGEKVF